MRRRSDLVLVSGFCAALLAPALAWRLDPQAWVALADENRRPASFPALPRSVEQWRAFPAALEAWQSDTLGLRTPLLCLNNVWALSAWHKLPESTLLLGRAGWIFYTGEDSRAVWRGLYPTPRDFAAKFAAALRSRQEWFARRGITYLYVIAPNKETVYPDQLPRGEQALGPTLLEQLEPELLAQPDLPLLDLRAALAEERLHDLPAQGDFVFHPHGTHWTARGAWRAAQEIAARLSEIDPSLHFPLPAPRAECLRVERDAALEDTWATSLRLQAVCSQRVYAFGPRARQSESCTPGSESLEARACLFERRDGAGERVLLSHDSFGPWLREPLAELCASLRTLWQDDPQTLPELVDAPRILIELCSERRLVLPPQWLEDPLATLAPEEFAALPALAPRAAAADSIGGLAPYPGGKIERAAAGGGVRLVAPDGGARVLLEGWELPPDRRLALHLVLSVPGATRATLWYETQPEQHFHRRRRVELPLAAGSNELYLRLPENGIVGGLVLQPGELAGEYRIERCEGRASR
jgi:hypothetical protein